MFTLSAAVVQASEEAEELPLIMPYWMFGVVILGAMLLIMLITLSFANVGHGHDDVQEAPDPQRQLPGKHG